MNDDDPQLATRDTHDAPRDHSAGPVYVKVEDARPDGYDGTCLRPLGLCELSGCCDACWYRPDHPRFQSSNPESAGVTNR